ncbi:MAG: hypothetical protein FIA96_06810 [Betaproteobacteria bacterium]|nr:hypothetical protein [Betaproteobacteria bacterium]
MCRDLLLVVDGLRLDRIRQGLAFVKFLVGVELLFLFPGFLQALFSILDALVNFGQVAIPHRIDILFAGIGGQQGKRAATFLGSLLGICLLLRHFGIAASLLLGRQRRFDLLRHKTAIVALFIGPALACGGQKVAAHLPPVGVVAAIDAGLGGGAQGEQNGGNKQQGGNQAHGGSP